MDHFIDLYFQCVLSSPFTLLFVFASAVWTRIVPRVVDRVGLHLKSGLQLTLIIFGPLVCASLLMSPVLLIMLYLITAGLVLPILRGLFDPHWLLLSFPILTLVWLICYVSKTRWHKVVAKTLIPWLLGMGIAGAIFIAARMWLPQSQWDKLFWIEKIASWCEVTLEKISPYPLLLNLFLLVVVFAVNLWDPDLKRWTRRFEKAVDLGRSAITVLAVFTSVTFFGAGQAAVLHEVTAQEKFDRLKDDATARAQLILESRLTDGPKVEAAETKVFLDVVHRNVIVDQSMPFDDFHMNRASMPKKAGLKELERWAREIDRERLEGIVRNRSRELLEWAARNPVMRQSASAIDNSQLAAMLQKKFTEDQKKEANDRFKKALDLFVEKGAELTMHPLTEVLNKGGLPNLTTEIITELYTSQMAALSKQVVDPLADSLFRRGSMEATKAIESISRASRHAVFHENMAPSKLVTPTVLERTQEQKHRTAIEKAARAGR